MHVHFNQPNPNVQLDALYAAARAEANREAARTRKKLSEFASKLAAALDCGGVTAVGLEPGEESREQAKRQNQQSQDGQGTQDGGAGSEGAHISVSGWL
ncbi:MAG: hypothetical protein WA172_08705 [Terriglobales bacterium]